MMVKRRRWAAGAVPPGWTPTLLGASLIAWWDLEQASSVTITSGAVQTWTDVIGGLAPTQGTAANRPAYNATGFNNRPVATFDGTNDVLVVSSTGGMPSGTSTGEMWALIDQTALVADTTARMPFAYGASTTGNGRQLQRIVETGTNHFRASGGNGTANINAGSPAVDLSGRHVIRSIIGATTITGEVDGVAGTSTALTVNTLTTRTTIGANAAAAGSSFFQGGINSILVTALLTAAQAAVLYAYLNGRR